MNKKRAMKYFFSMVLNFLVLSSCGGPSSASHSTSSNEVASLDSSSSVATSATSSLTPSTSSDESSSSLEVSSSSSPETPSSSTPEIPSSSSDHSRINLPFSTEGNLAEKTLSYWNAEAVTVTIAELTENNSYHFAYEAAAAAPWVSFQLLYKNSDLVSGEAYRLTFSLSSNQAGAITVNGKEYSLIAGDNQVVVKYQCGVDVSATTGLLVFFGTSTGGFLPSMDFTCEGFSWENVPLHNYTSPDWKSVMKGDNGQFAGDYYYFDDDGTVNEHGNPYERANGIVRNGVAVGASYSVGFTAQGAQSYPVTERTEVGIVPYYVDDANWILFYVDYSPSERPSGVRVFEVMGFIGGTFVGFNDFWGDNAAYASLASQPSNANALRVDVSTTGTIKSFSFYFNNNIVASKDFDFGLVSSNSATYGICSMGDTLAFTQIKYEEKTENISQFHWDYRSVALGTASESGGAVTLGNADFQRNFYDTTAAGAAGSYTVTAKMTGTEGYPTTKEVQEGIVPWYVNDGNYLVAYIHWLPSVSSLFEVQLTGAVGWVNVGWNGFAVNSDSAAYVPSAEQTLAITKAGGKFTCSLNGAAVGAEIDLSSHASDAWSAQARVGYYCFNTTATFSGLAVTK